MKKTMLFAACVLCTLNAREIPLNGGYLKTGRDVQIESYGDDMNFMYACRFADGSVHLMHSKGIHTVTERGCFEISKDNGKTWQHAETAFGKNCFDGLDGKKYHIACKSDSRKKVHTTSLYRWNETTMKGELVVSHPIVFPHALWMRMHRDVIRTRSGKLLLPGYGNIEGDKNLHTFVICSADDGRTWKYLSTVARDPEGKTAEGPNEATIFQLKDGRICVFYRDNGQGYLKQCFSSDDGKTWSKPEEVRLFKGCASPNGIVLADGTIVVASGRPNDYLLIDFTGTGKHYQKAMFYCGAGSNYTSIMEIAPNEILCIYDESYFGGAASPTPFSRIHASTFKVVRSARKTAVSADPLAAKYANVFRPVSLKAIADGKMIYSPGTTCYKPAGTVKDYNATCDVITIPERPHPVLRLKHSGEAARWAKFRCQNWTLNYNRIKLGIEFRLNDMGEKRPQLMVNAVIGANAQFPGYLAGVKFANDRFELATHRPGNPSAVDYKPFPCDIGNVAFHAFALEANADEGTVSLFKEGETKPLATVKMPKAVEGSIAAVNFGSGTGNLSGCADISYFAWQLE